MISNTGETGISFLTGVSQLICFDRPELAVEEPLCSPAFDAFIPKPSDELITRLGKDDALHSF